MNREEFMTRLESLLSGISEEERREALQYYEDYFDDAGTGNEQKVMEEFGSPEKLAATIRMNLNPGSEEHGEFTEQGFRDERFEKREIPAAHAGYRRTDREWSYPDQETKPRTSKWLKILLIIAIVVVAAPVVVPLVGGIIAAVIGIVIAVFATLFSFVIASGAIAVSGFIVMIAGPIVAVGFPSAILTIGVGILMLTVGAIATVATVKLCMVMCPAIFNMIVNICRRLIHRKVVE